MIDIFHSSPFSFYFFFCFAPWMRYVQRMSSGQIFVKSTHFFGGGDKIKKINEDMTVFSFYFHTKSIENLLIFIGIFHKNCRNLLYPPFVNRRGHLISKAQTFQEVSPNQNIERLITAYCSGLAGRQQRSTRNSANESENPTRNSRNPASSSRDSASKSRSAARNSRNSARNSRMTSPSAWFGRTLSGSFLDQILLSILST